MSGLSKQLRRMGAAVLGLLFPVRCHACAMVFKTPGQTVGESATLNPSLSVDMTRAMGALVCPTCLAAFKPITPPLCDQCGKVFNSREGQNHLCGNCLTAPKQVARARAAGAYEGPLKALVQGLKYKGKTMLAQRLGDIAFIGFQQHWKPESIDVVLPVPLHGKRMRQRGFNQAWLLIRDWPERVKQRLGETHHITVAGNILIRHRATAPQTGLEKHQRQTNIRGAFSVTKPESVSGKRILLVDDVYTTGATVEECARMLLSAGAARVDVLTIAKTV